MTKIPFTLTLLALLALARPAAAADRPNIVLIMADDMGFSDLSCYGSEIPTPHIDALAAGGLRFTQFYNTGRCCPTRASLLTGLYPHQAGIGHMTDPGFDAAGRLLRGYEGRLDEGTATLAEVLRGAGYFTAMAGKWHVGQNHGVVPWERGFMRSLNSPAGGFYYPGKKASLFLNGQAVGDGGRAGVPAEWYSSDLWTDYGLKFVDEARQAKQPFFLYVAENAPHFPLQAPAETIARFRGRYRAGSDKLREERYRRQIAMGLIDPSWPLSPRPADVPAWDSLTPEQQDHYDHLMAIYAAVVSRLDDAVGRLVAGLKERGLLDNTVILFLSDNGGNAESGVAGRMLGENPGGPGSTVFAGQCWATLENTPFRRYKHYNHEGGIATPLIVHWPAGIPEGRDGQWETTPGHLIDLMATFVDLGRATYPKTRDGHAVPPMEGVSLRPAFTGGAIVRPRPIFWEHEGNAAVRDGDWKLVRLGGTGRWELYNLQADRTEQHDLAAEQPKRATAMAAAWQAWADGAYVFPKPKNPDGKKKGRKKKAGLAEE